MRNKIGRRRKEAILRHRKQRMKLKYQMMMKLIVKTMTNHHHQKEGDYPDQRKDYEMRENVLKMKLSN